MMKKEEIEDWVKDHWQDENSGENYKIGVRP